MSSALHLDCLLDTCVHHDANELQLTGGEAPALSFDDRRATIDIPILTARAVGDVIDTLTSAHPQSEPQHPDQLELHLDHAPDAPGSSPVRFRVLISRQRNEIVFQPQR